MWRISRTLGTLAILVIALLGAMMSGSPASAKKPDPATYVQTYAQAHGIPLTPDTAKYGDFFHGVLLGDYPDLLQDPAGPGQEALLTYAVQALNLPPDQTTTDQPGTATLIEAHPDQPQVAYNRQTAANYAYNMAYACSNNYPYYDGNDCTNFASQAAVAGGLSQRDDPGWRCRNEATTSYWFMKRPNDPFCWSGPNREWAWSSSWVATNDFSSALSNLGYANTYLYGNTDPEIRNLSSAASLGDFVQLRMCCWTTPHTMVVTAKSGTTIWLSYHSPDTRNKSIWDIPRSQADQYRLIHIRN